MASLVPPFTEATAKAKVQRAEDLWNTKDPNKVALAYTPDSVWRNRDQFLRGREEIIGFLQKKWDVEKRYKLRKRYFCHNDNKIAVEFEYEYLDEVAGQWWRAYGIEHWTFNQDGVMERRDMSANNIPISSEERMFK
ncbi:hypothetical protein SELMODRAFT_406555 [Selaginella moellendorffii]|uniref:SnoaL-like domain-containing protein n=1 Tax=Selaginella moellendorffii TaxID=88036 RepID=D8R2S1_SELML|nr:uncharacterized protein LOC9659093 [Selaginella moellendorffii]XP_002986607.1 uncharacterized protein LOC9658769 [Selaginella moellendorffii]EFJ12464.1 hypothetical protein SELMODRAFT_124366 [Selaginella moellendorffii]EFJ34119.1 hypothetical protein SELMODRAFT_406555 [Selaginella moellendorffii]|eukprot:XP_002965281.1 uncharacterized protein LOC9659093 [Selaginella moellendorffii]